MTERAVTNSTVYDTDDIMAVVETVMVFLPKEHTIFDPKKVRIHYLNKPKRWEPDSPVWVVTEGWGENIVLHIGILREKNLKQNALLLLAAAATPTDDDDKWRAPGSVMSNLIVGIANCSGTFDQIDLIENARAAVVNQGLTININRKAKGRKEYTLQKLKESLENKLWSRKRLDQRIIAAQQELDFCKGELPRCAEKIAELKKKIAEKEE